MLKSLGMACLSLCLTLSISGNAQDSNLSVVRSTQTRSAPLPITGVRALGNERAADTMWDDKRASERGTKEVVLSVSGDSTFSLYGLSAGTERDVLSRFLGALIQEGMTFEIWVNGPVTPGSGVDLRTISIDVLFPNQDSMEAVTRTRLTPTLIFKTHRSLLLAKLGSPDLPDRRWIEWYAGFRETPVSWVANTFDLLVTPQGTPDFKDDNLPAKNKITYELMENLLPGYLYSARDRRETERLPGGWSVARELRVSRANSLTEEIAVYERVTPKIISELTSESPETKLIGITHLSELRDHLLAASDALKESDPNDIPLKGAITRFNQDLKGLPEALVQEITLLDQGPITAEVISARCARTFNPNSYYKNENIGEIQKKANAWRADSIRPTHKTRYRR